MNKNIPRHCLVVAVGADDIVRDDLVSSSFKSHEIVSCSGVASDLIGERDDARLAGVIFPEMRRRVALKLSLGERVVVNASNLKKEDRLSFARMALDIGVPVFYILADTGSASASAISLWRAAQKDLYRGDGIAEVVDIDVPINVISRDNPALEALQREWDGVTIIADVHGMQQSLIAAVKWARMRRNYIIFLGDIIDYGAQTLEVADTVYSLVMQGDAELMIGNHERKIARWIKQSDRGYASNLSDGNKVTTNALGDLSSRARDQWIGRFNGLFNQGRHIRSLGNFTFSHAAIHPGFWSGTASQREIETSAMFGEFAAPLKTNVFVPRTYGWVDRVPAGETVVVGHDIRRKEAPLKVVGELGGTVLFLDTGCGKGGWLSSVDLRWTPHGMSLQNINMY